MSTTELARIRELSECKVCGQLPLRPLFLPACGHSTVCEACCREKKLKVCVTCNTPIRTPIRNLKINRTLELVLRALFVSEYSRRPHRHEVASELECNQSMALLHASVQLYAADLRPDYTTQASELLRLHHAEGDSRVNLRLECECGLVCLPIASRKRKRYFFGCPRWTPVATVADNKPCACFKWLSTAQRHRLGLDRME